MLRVILYINESDKLIILKLISLSYTNLKVDGRFLRYSVATQKLHPMTHPYVFLSDPLLSLGFRRSETFLGFHRSAIVFLRFISRGETTQMGRPKVSCALCEAATTCRSKWRIGNSCQISSDALTRRLPDPGPTKAGRSTVFLR